MTITDQVHALMQGTDYGDQQLKDQMSTELAERLSEAAREHRPLRVYCGFDPRTADLHIGHTVPMAKLRQFQQHGHEVTFVVGTGTAMLGDPSDKTSPRAALTRAQAIENGQTYADQASRVLDPGATTVRFNHEWLDGLSAYDLAGLASHFSVQQLMTRENFKMRLDRDEPVWLHEAFYSLLQGFDAYTLRADVQVGGSDQIFNIVTASRRVMSALGARPNVAVIVGILPGTDGVVKMSKSLGNHVPLNASALEMHALVMSIPDAAMRRWFDLVSQLPAGEIDRVLSLHPKEAKAFLACRIVSLYRSASDAERASEEFEKVHSKRELPSEMPRFSLHGPVSIAELMASAGLASSRSDARRLIAQGGVRLDGIVVSDPELMITQAATLQVGRRRFLRIFPGRPTAPG